MKGREDSIRTLLQEVWQVWRKLRNRDRIVIVWAIISVCLLACSEEQEVGVVALTAVNALVSLAGVISIQSRFMNR